MLFTMVGDTISMLLSLGAEWYLIFALGGLLVTAGFVFGSLWVSEVGIAFAIAHLILQFAPLATLPGIVGSVVGAVPWVPGETVLFLLLVVFGSLWRNFATDFKKVW
jgi:hypothetical protein